MKKEGKRILLALAMLSLLLMPIAFAADTVASIGTGSINLITENFVPLIWGCDNRLVLDDNVQSGRVSAGGEQLIERENNYAFEGEQIAWDILVMDKNGIEKIEDVFVTVGTSQGTGTDIESNCNLATPWEGGTAIEELCYKNESSGWTCYEGEIPLKDYGVVSGTVQYSESGPALYLLVSLSGLKPSTQYQLTLNGRDGNDGNEELGNNCANPDAPAEGYTCAFECGFGAGGTGIEGYWNFDMEAMSDSEGNFYQEYSLVMPEGHYGIWPAYDFGFGFIVKEVLAGDSCNWNDYMPVLMDSHGMDWIITDAEPLDPVCNARINEEILYEFDPSTMAYYTCILTVESPESMHGEYWLTANVVDLDEQLATMDENEFWYFNPVIALTLNGLPLDFGIVRPGTVKYSNTILVGNGADVGTGVMMDMFITGTDFYDITHSRAKCPITNQLSLENFRYYAVNGFSTTIDDQENDLVDGDRDVDTEGYVNIEYGNSFGALLFDNAEIIQSPEMNGKYYVGNLLSPGSELAITFKLALPEPCNGDFTDGNIYFWGEAI